MIPKIQDSIKFFNLFLMNGLKSSHCEDPAFDVGDVGRIDPHFALYHIRFRASFAMTS